MPSKISNGPFLGLRPDPQCGREDVNGHHQLDGAANGGVNGHHHHHDKPSTPFVSLRSGPTTPNGSQSASWASLNGLGKAINGHTENTNGYSHNHSHDAANGNGTFNGGDEFLRLDTPKQDVLVLHGPRQKYSLERATDIPALKSDDELLIQVLAIGLNPVDWKGPDYGFGQPAYPWVNGRDFAGIVVRPPRRRSSRIQSGDVVFGPSTDYRDVRKAAYQEYVVTTDSNVARIPKGYNVKHGAALGVAFVAAAIGLGSSFGLDFGDLVADVPRGPNLHGLARAVDRSAIPEDVRAEVFEHLPYHERPQKGEWIVIWGGSSTTGIMALQLAKFAGLRVISVADVAKNGKKLLDFGADMLVDRFDQKRAAEVIRSITGDQLRFAIDVTGRESATILQDILVKSKSSLRRHLLGYTGLPKTTAPEVQHHSVPIKLFHNVPAVGESLMEWLEDLLASQTLKLPEIEVANGGLAGINAALDKMRNGAVSGKRIVVPVTRPDSEHDHSQTATNGIPPTVDNSSDEFAYADQLNSDPDRVKFAYWVPNVSGGLVVSKIPQRTGWDLKANERYARTAERVGLEFALMQIRFMAGYGAENQHESVSFSQALLHGTSRIRMIAALLPGPWNPALAAKQIASIDHYSEGRIDVNVVSGWFKTEMTSIGQWWLDHSERYRRSREFIECLRGIWTQETFSYHGDFYQFNNYPLKPKPLSLPGRPHPVIFQGGNSHDARENGGAVSDVYFMNGNTLEGLMDQIADVSERARKYGREGKVKFALNGFVICRDTEEEAVQVLREIQGKADVDAVEAFRGEVQNAGASTANKTGMWAGSEFNDLVQYNDGFKTKLIGTPQQIAERIVMLKSLGIDIILTAFLHYEEEIQLFGEKVLPLVRQLERQGRGKDRDFEIRLTGDVYRQGK